MMVTSDSKSSKGSRCSLSYCVHSSNSQSIFKSSPTSLAIVQMIERRLSEARILVTK